MNAVYWIDVFPGLRSLEAAWNLLPDADESAARRTEDVHNLHSHAMLRVLREVDPSMRKRMNPDFVVQMQHVEAMLLRELLAATGIPEREFVTQVQEQRKKEARRQELRREIMGEDWLDES